MQARDLMSTNVTVVPPEMPVAAVVETLASRGISAVPVVGADGAPLGVVTEGDLIRRLAEEKPGPLGWFLGQFGNPGSLADRYAKAHGRTARDVMTREVIQVGEETPVDEIADLLERHRIKRVPVTREGRVVGIVSRANLLHGLASAPTAPRESAPDDLAIRLQLAGELESRGFGAGVVPNVVVHDGVVHLWGSVASEAERKAVRIAAEEIPGVIRVVDHTIIPPPILY